MISRVRFIVLLLGVVVSPFFSKAINTAESLIVIISSYNPETFQTSQTIHEFMEEYRTLGGTNQVIIENMNCKSFSEAPSWKYQIKEIFDKYAGQNKPAAIIMLGQEAWASYISQETMYMQDVPLLCGMISRDVVLLPDHAENLVNCQPECIDALKRRSSNIGGFLYEYSVVENIRLIRKFYPEVRHIAFVSDNTYGGVSLQAHVRRDMQQHFPGLDLICLDGRKHTIYTIVKEIRNLPENTAILMGTWRVDKNEGFFMQNATYSMMSANPKLPAFSMTTLGLGYWVLGGYIPVYRNVGRDLGRQVYEIIHRGGGKGSDMLNFIPNTYKFDLSKLKERGISKKLLPDAAEFVNKDTSFWSRYWTELLFIGVVFILLLVAFVITLYFYFRAKRLTGELIVSKEKAEESERLKTAFLANMSHEIRTPLNAIVGFSNILVSKPLAVEKQRHFVEIIQTNSDLLLRLINDILDISRLEAGKTKFDYTKCEVVSLCTGVLATAGFSRKEGVTYVFEHSENTFELETDVQRLQQVLINLLTNANKFTEQGEIRLELKVDHAKQMVEFAVTDTGCGIPEEKQEFVFDRFAKLSEFKQGTGLGLAICRMTVSMLGGEIWVDKYYKKGARFVFTHPFHRP